MRDGPDSTEKTPYGLAMLALSAGKPLISVGNLGENHGFQNHLNYIRVDARVDPSAEQAESSESVEGRTACSCSSVGPVSPFELALPDRD